MELSRRRLAAASGAALASGVLWTLFSRDESTGPAVDPVPGVTAASDVGPDQLERIVDGNADFGFAMLRRLVSADPDENLLVSPASVGFALGMTYAGARGETEAQIAETVRFPDDHDPHSAHQQVQHELNERARAVTAGTLELAVANAVWGLEEYPYRDEYLELLDARYGAELQTVDFVDDPEGARVEINEWIADRTNDHIDELFPDGTVDQYTRLVLTNAIYLLADWHHQFDESDTRDEAFTALDGQTATVPLMRQTETFPYAESDGHQLIELPYIGEEIGMIVLLPAEGEFEEFEDELDTTRLSEYIDGFEQQDGEIVLPRFEFESGVSLNDLLSEMGMPVAFDHERANFDGMAPLAEIDENVYIDDVFHDAYIAVDEEGTEAAAATGVETAADAAPAVDFRMVVDRPFLFLIRDRVTGATLFLGRVVDLG